MIKQTIEELTDRLIRTEILCCQTSLVDMLLKQRTEEIGSGVDGFDWGEVDNLYPDPSDWTIDQCYAYLGKVDGRVIGDLHIWREYIKNTAEPIEVLNWWLITSYMTKLLKQINEPILSNDYGQWWGRTCSGQSINQDGTIQKIAHNILENAT